MPQGFWIELLTSLEPLHPTTKRGVMNSNKSRQVTNTLTKHMIMYVRIVLLDYLNEPTSIPYVTARSTHQTFKLHPINYATV